MYIRFFYMLEVLSCFFQESTNEDTMEFRDWQMVSAGEYRSRADQTVASQNFLLLIVPQRISFIDVVNRYDQLGGRSRCPWLILVMIDEVRRKVKLVGSVVDSE